MLCLSMMCVVDEGGGGKGGAAMTTGLGTMAGESHPGDPGGQGSQGATPSAVEAFRLYETMVLIRRTEERLRDDSAAGKLPGAVHLYIGEEAIAAGVCAHLQATDYATSTHRGHGHFLAKGGDVRTMMAEIWAKREGICQGMGGSMHVADLSKGILGANGIVGAGLSIATGAAFGAKLEGEGRVSVCFFGDGASNQGALMETLNLAALWQLPLVFVCENNGFSEFTPAAQVTAGRISDRARAFAVPVAEVDGNDVTEVWRAAGEAVKRAREGGGPSFIEARTYRIQGHFEAESFVLSGGRYREDAEIERWRQADPITRFRARLIETSTATAADLNRIDDGIGDRVADAVAYAEAGQPADPALALTLMFAPETSGPQAGEPSKEA
jgi:TPP-dependent pyruvate/acetoin dehydrogenase alpha subunit